jgi:hypothetical protein
LRPLAPAEGETHAEHVTARLSFLRALLASGSGVVFMAAAGRSAAAALRWRGLPSAALDSLLEQLAARALAGEERAQVLELFARGFELSL